jgi:hypothetical protein
MKTFKILFSLIFLAVIQVEIYAQIGISSNGAAVSPNAMLDISSTTKGLLIPRMNQAARNAISDTKGMLIYNTDNDHFNFNNGTNWQNIGNLGDIPWEISGTSIYSSNAGNVGIGVSNPTQAKLVVNGGVSGQVALFKSVSGISIDGSEFPSIGFNYDNGKAITAGAGSILRFDPTIFGGSAGVLDLNFYKTKTAGSLFSTPINVIKFQDFSAFGLGYWLDLNTTPNSNSRTNISNRMHSESNGNLNLIPLGVINFKVDDFDNATINDVIAHNVGNTADFMHSKAYFNYDAGDFNTHGYMHLRLNLNILTKQYNNIYVVGAPNISNSAGHNIESSFARFQRLGDGTMDQLQIWVGASELSGVEVFGTLMVYGTKND